MCSELTVVPLLTLTINHISNVTIDLVLNVAIVVVVARIVECNNETRIGFQVFVFEFEFVCRSL